MEQRTALRSGVAGTAVGVVSAGGLWWAEGFLDGMGVLIAAVSVVWAAATAASLYVFASRPDWGDDGPWGAVIAGSLLFSVALNLSEVALSPDVHAALTLLVLGFTTLGYTAGVASVSHRERPAPASEETATEG
ncbi:hypothetical protein ABNG03_00480 [Halorubrum sp. RMP-47]|uniref:SPW repeat-containing protein n=1 Tax=Halorubrum miltondacostae TaxID=3076378 RepID=A0ABD5LYY2_9EURY